MHRRTNIRTSNADFYSTIKLINKHKAAEILGISPSTLKKYRLDKNSTLLEGIHYYVLNSRTIRYNAVLLADWAVNRHNLQEHTKKIEAFLSNLQRYPYGR